MVGSLGIKERDGLTARLVDLVGAKAPVLVEAIQLAARLKLCVIPRLRKRQVQNP
jgi:hypothetical protein